MKPTQASISHLTRVLLCGVALVGVFGRAGYGFERWPQAEMAVERGLFGAGMASSGFLGGRAGLDPPGVGFSAGSAAMGRFLRGSGFLGLGRLGLDPPGLGIAPGEPAWVRAELGSPLGRMSGLTEATPLNNYLLWRLNLDPSRFAFYHPRTAPLLAQQLVSLSSPGPSSGSSVASPLAPQAMTGSPSSGSSSGSGSSPGLGTPSSLSTGSSPSSGGSSPSSGGGSTTPPGGGSTTPPITPPQTQSVPEPSSAVLLVLGVSSLAGVRRLRGKHRRTSVPAP